VREEPIKGRQPKSRLTASKRDENDEQAFPTIVMPVPRGAAHRAVAQGADGIAFRIKLPCRCRCVRRMQQVSILGGEQKDQPVDETQKLTEEFGQREHAGPQPLAQRGVVGM
jgi:hypothetical protein